MRWFSSRWEVWRRVFFNKVTTWILAGYALLGGLTWVRDELLFKRYGHIKLLTVLPDWSLLTWLVVGFACAWMITLELSYRLVSKLESKPTIEPSPEHQEIVERELSGLSPSDIELLRHLFHVGELTNDQAFGHLHRIGITYHTQTPLGYLEKRTSLIAKSSVSGSYVPNKTLEFAAKKALMGDRFQCR